VDYNGLIDLWYGFGYSGEILQPKKFASDMKNKKISVLGLALVVVFASCSKKDVYDENTNEVAAQASSTAVQASNAGWQAASQWESAKQDNLAVYYFNIEDAKITPEVASDGLVLVYKKKGGASVAMPYEEKNGSDSVYWYHQVTDGNLLILSDTYGSAVQPTSDNQFSYLVINPDQLKSLEAKGHSRSDLMDMTYEQASQILTSSN
jgi:hypothetical protein